MESFARVSLRLIKADEQETHSDYGEDSADGTKHRLGWYHTADPFRNVRALDGCVQR
jgi:hypothetical protein